jgi:hypothetical protein
MVFYRCSFLQLLPLSAPSGCRKPIVETFMSRLFNDNNQCRLKWTINLWKRLSDIIQPGLSNEHGHYTVSA